MPPDHRIYKAINTRKKLLEGMGICKMDVSRLSRLRRKRSYQNDKREYRHYLNIPISGYRRREAERELSKFEGTEFEILPYLVVKDFAKKHPLDKQHQMPFEVAFEEVVYTRPRPSFSPIVGLWGNFKNGDVFLAGGKKAPQPIKRLVLARIQGKDSKVARCVNVITEGGGTGVWVIVREP